ncbi:MAG: NRDE family protein [Gammaproteobacteria bacterium]|nr:NRDE family protein [Gammaproteobacteria bacterium]MDE2346783.1 NRDE family protein [Gammaproteobacteria bacterium]
MCLLVLAWKTHPDYPLIFAGNRDELHARPSAAAGFWPHSPRVLAGRDLQAGGTWLGLTTDGRFAVVTNYRAGLNPEKAERSRGELAADFLQTRIPAHVYLREVAKRANKFGAFSLIVGDRGALWYLSNRGESEPQQVTPGIHGLSNHLLDTPWPKVTRSMAALNRLLERQNLNDTALFALLADRGTAADELLPDTGIGTERERQVAPVFVANPVYGTRCSSLILLHADGQARFAERRFAADGGALETRIFHHSVCTR